MKTHFDLRQLHDALNTDRDLVYEMLNLFQQLQPSMTVRLENALANGDAIEIREAMHILKSRLRNIYCPQLGNDTEEIEHLAKENQFESINTAYSKLRPRFDELQAEIVAFLNEAGR